MRRFPVISSISVATRGMSDGFVSAVNARAALCGGEIGISAKELVARLAAARVKDLKR